VTTTLPPTPAVTAAPPDVLVAFVSPGDVSEFDAADRLAVKTSLAAEAAVPPTAVTVTVRAASVLVTATIATTSAAQAASIQSSLAASLSTPAAAQSVLGVPVSSTPTVVVSAPSGDDDGGGGGGGVPMAAVIGGGVGGALVIGVLIVAALKWGRTPWAYSVNAGRQSAGRPRGAKDVAVSMRDGSSTKKEAPALANARSMGAIEGGSPAARREFV
jgi:hypothetical protein